MRRTSHARVIRLLTEARVRQLSWCDMNDDLVRSVTEELRWDPRVDAERISVSVDDRTVTLKGVVQSYSVKCCAERIAREIRGVVDVKNELEVRLTIGSCRTDAGLERLGAEILQNHTAL